MTQDKEKMNSSKFLWHLFPKTEPLVKSVKWVQAVDILRRKATLDDELDPRDLNEALLVLLKLCGDMGAQMLLLECIVELPHVQKYGEWLSEVWFSTMPKTLKTFNELFPKFDCQHAKRVFFRLFLNTFNVEIKNNVNDKVSGVVTSIPAYRGTWNGEELKPPIMESFWLDINMGASLSLSLYVDKATFPSQETKCEGTSCEPALIVIHQRDIRNVSLLAVESYEESSLIELFVELETAHLLVLLIKAEYKLLLIKTLSELGLCVKEIEREGMVVPPQTPNPTPNEFYCWADSGSGVVDSAATRVSFLCEQSARMTLSPPCNTSSEFNQGQSEQEKSNANKSNQLCTTKLESQAATESRAFSAEPKPKVAVKSGKRREIVKGGQGQNFNSHDQLKRSCDEKEKAEVPIPPVSKRLRSKIKGLEDKPRKGKYSINMIRGLNPMHDATTLPNKTDSTTKFLPKNRKRKREGEFICHRVITRSAQRMGFIREATEPIQRNNFDEQLREIQSVTDPGYPCESDQSEITFVIEESEALHPCESDQSVIPFVKKESEAQVVQEKEVGSEDSKPCVNLDLPQQSLGESHIKLQPTQFEIPTCKMDSSVLPPTSKREAHIVPELSCADTAMKQSPEKNPSIDIPPAQYGILFTKVDSGGQESSERSPLNMSQFSHPLLQQSSPTEELTSGPLSLQSEVQTDMQESTSVVHALPQHVNESADVDPLEPPPQKHDVQVVYDSKSSPVLGKKFPCKTPYHHSIPSSSRTESHMPKGVPMDIGFKHLNTLNFTKNPFNPAHPTFLYQLKSSGPEIATGGKTPENNGSSLKNVPHNSEELSAPKTPFIVSNEKQECSDGHESARQCGDAGIKLIYDHAPSVTSVKEHDYYFQHHSDITSVTAIPYSGGSVAVEDSATSEDLSLNDSDNLSTYSIL